MQHIFLTGAVGQLGTALAEQLVQQGYNLTCFIHVLENQDTSFLKSIGVARVVHGDLRKIDDIASHIQKESIILHCYSLSPGANQSQEVYDVHNLQVSQNLLQIAEQKKVKQFIYIGTCSVIGPKATKDHYLAESDPLGPDEPYGKSKLAVEQEIKSFYDRSKIPSLILRVFPIYGPHAHPNATPVKLCKLLQKKRFFILGDGNNHYEFGFTKNIAGAIISAMQKIRIGVEIIHCTEPIKRSYNEIVRELAKYVNPKVQFVHIPIPIAITAGYTGDVLSFLFRKRFIFRTRSVRGLLGGWNADTTKMQRLLQYKQPYSMEEGVKEFIEWVKESKILEKEWQKPEDYLDIEKGMKK